MTSRPHDALFKAAFESLHGAAALLRELLPPAVRDVIAWETLDHDRGSFVDAGLDDHHCDLLFSARLRTGDPDVAYLLLEHQSTVDPAMPLRWLIYQAQIWDRFRRDRPGARLPLVVGVVVSHAPGGWSAARSFDELLDPVLVALPGVAAQIPRCSLSIEDLTSQSDDELAARTLPPFQKVALWLLRDSRDPARLLANLDPGSVLVRAGLSRLSRDEWAMVVSYLHRVLDPVYQDALRAKLFELSALSEEAIMTIADVIMQEARIDMLRKLILYKFRALSTEDEARLQAATSDAIERYALRLLTADSLAAVFEE